MIERLKPIDMLLLNGDLIDGRQEKGNGDELITGGYHPQLIEMFIKVYNEEEVEA
jgi:hypothetical protein